MVLRETEKIGWVVQMSFTPIEMKFVFDEKRLMAYLDWGEGGE